MKRRMNAAMSPAPLWKDTPDYPGVPAVVAKSTARATVDYDTYVLRYAATMRTNGLLLFAGVAVAMAGGIWLGAPVAYFVGALGLGMIAGGAIGLAAALTAHREYREIAVSVTETYAQPEPRQAPVMSRPFVATSNGAGRTTMTDKFPFSDDVWRAAFQTAATKDGYLRRDDWQRAILDNMPRRDDNYYRTWYHGEGWTKATARLQKVGLLDAENKFTPAAWLWYHTEIALPQDDGGANGAPERTNGGANGANGPVGGME